MWLSDADSYPWGMRAPSPVHFPSNNCCTWLLTVNNEHRRTNRCPSGPLGCQMNSSLSQLWTSSLASLWISGSIIPAMMVPPLLACWTLGTRSLKCPGVNFDLNFGGTLTVSSGGKVLCLETRISRAMESRVKALGSKTPSRSLRLIIIRDTLTCTPWFLCPGVYILGTQHNIKDVDFGDVSYHEGWCPIIQAGVSSAHSITPPSW